MDFYYTYTKPDYCLKTKQVLEELTSLSVAGATTSSDPVFPVII